MCFFISSKKEYLEEELSSNLKNLSCKKYHFQKLTPFSKENNVLDAAPSNIDDFLCMIHVFLQLCLKGLFGRK
jgi:hypothetical protein